MGLTERLAAVRARIEDACGRAGRDAGAVTLVAVAKDAELAQVLELAAGGHQDFGENRMQEAVPKIEGARGAGFQLMWHLVGHLQTNKVPQAVGTFGIIETVDSRRVAEAISRRAVFHDVTIPVLLQVNVAQDPAKHGFMRDDVVRDYAEVCNLAGLEVNGLMTIGRLVSSAEESRPDFAALRELREELDAMQVAPPLRHLSMGMSADFEVGVEEGATIVRVGNAIFARR
jgi:pyridoxal phosphate enzyme (YggS family)